MRPRDSTPSMSRRRFWAGKSKKIKFCTSEAASAVEGSLGEGGCVCWSVAGRPIQSVSIKFNCGASESIRVVGVEEACGHLQTWSKPWKMFRFARSRHAAIQVIQINLRLWDISKREVGVGCGIIQLDKACCDSFSRTSWNRLIKACFDSGDLDPPNYFRKIDTTGWWNSSFAHTFPFICANWVNTVLLLTAPMPSSRTYVGVLYMPTALKWRTQQSGG